MSEIKSPYLVTRHEIYVSDDIYYPDLQKKVLFRAAKLPAKQSRKKYALEMLAIMGVVLAGWVIWYGVARAIDLGF